MKKLIILVTVLVLVLAIAATFVLTNSGIPALRWLNDNNVSKLEGRAAGELYEAWGEPDSVLSGMYGDIWEIDGENMVVVYYDGRQDSKVMGAHISKIQKDPDRVYVYRDSADELMKPGFVLKEDGTFSMTFSVISSYIAIGTYELNEETLSLYTRDGEFEYHFDVADDGFAFDAEKSSKVTWFADIPDGAIFR